MGPTSGVIVTGSRAFVLLVGALPYDSHVSYGTASTYCADTRIPFAS